MSAPRKRWEDHSPRWIRNAEKQGLDKNRWNNWLKQSSATKRATDARQYAAGVGIKEQKRAKAEKLAYDRLVKLAGPDAGRTRIQRNVQRMSGAQLATALTLSPNELRKKASNRTASNPWWYH